MMITKIAKQLAGSLNFGINDNLKPYERRRARVFNYCNFAGFSIAVIRLVYLLFSAYNNYTTTTLFINALPLVLCGIMAACMLFNRYVAAIIISFALFPPALLTMAVFTSDSSLGIYLVLYMIFTFFFLHHRYQIIITFCWVLTALAIMQFFLPAIIRSNGLGNQYRPDTVLSIINFTSGALFIFITMYFIKFEVWKFEKSISKKKEGLKKLNTLKDKVFSVIAHDLRTPINSIILLLRSVEKVHLSADDFKAYLPEIRANMEQTGNLLDNLFTWARSQVQQTEIDAKEISISRLTQQTIRFLERAAADKHIQLVNEVSAEYFAYADENSTQIVLRNLLANAIKFTGSGGCVKVKCVAQGNYINVTVEDNGIGIPADKQPLIFSETYYTSPGTNKEAGTGLGLLICRDLLQKNGGSLLFSSQPGKGSTFTFSLPGLN